MILFKICLLLKRLISYKGMTDPWSSSLQGKLTYWKSCISDGVWQKMLTSRFCPLPGSLSRLDWTFGRGTGFLSIQEMIWEAALSFCDLMCWLALLNKSFPAQSCLFIITATEIKPGHPLLHGLYIILPTESVSTDPQPGSRRLLVERL